MLIFSTTDSATFEALASTGEGTSLSMYAFALSSHSAAFSFNGCWSAATNSGRSKSVARRIIGNEMWEGRKEALNTARLRKSTEKQDGQYLQSLKPRKWSDTFVNNVFIISE